MPQKRMACYEGTYLRFSLANNDFSELSVLSTNYEISNVTVLYE